MRNSQSIRCIFDILGKYNRTEDEAKQSYLAYLELAKEIARLRLDASISIKPSTFGGTMNRDLTLKLVKELAIKVHGLGIRVEIDMEGQRMVDLTLLLAEACNQSGVPVTIALQAYLNRTHRDIERMMDEGITVRLVKGAYTGDISDYSIIDEVFKDLVEQMVTQDFPFCVATHDPEIIEWTTKRVADKDIIEFGFLKGLADVTKEKMANEGWKVAEYVPFGKTKEGYEARRKTYLKKIDELGRYIAP
jgi:proline dehydrogenase